MKIIHCADIHLDSAMKTHFDEATAKQRREELMTSFFKMMEWAKEERVQAVLIAGDLYDVRDVSKRTRTAVLDCLSKYPEIRVYYLKGNHDHAGLNVKDDHEMPDNLHFFDEDWTRYIVQESGRRKVVLYGAELGKDDHTKLYDDLHVAQEDINIVMLHGQTAKTKKSGRAETIALERLKNLGIDYLALGHIHMHLEEPLDKRGVMVYPGCLEGRGFDECGEHGFMLLDIDTELGKIERKFIPFAKRTLHELAVDVSGCEDANDVGERVQAAWNNACIPAEDMVKLILTGEVKEGCDTDVGLLVQQYRDKVFYADKIAEEKSLRGSYVRLIRQDDSISEDEKKVLIRTGILALSGEWERLQSGFDKMLGYDE